jgi:hypothetical protein
MPSDPPTPDDPNLELLERLEGDRLVDELVDGALAPYMAALSPEQIAERRAFIGAFITTHPTAGPLFERLRKRRVTATSQKRAREAEGDAEATAETSRKGRG